MTTITQKRTQEFVTELELAWLNLLRKALSASASGHLLFQSVTVKPGRVYAERVLETIHCEETPSKPR
mgnify:CR=1 FL=1